MRASTAKRRRDNENGVASGAPLHRMSARAIVGLLHREDARVHRALGGALEQIAQAAELAAALLGAGGRLRYAGAGTSGRLAALDAAELPPTFGFPARRIAVLLAGGSRALSRAQEGAEDDAAAGRAAVARRVRRGDVVIGVAASGATPFTLAVVEAARRAGALTIAVTAVGGSPLARAAEIAVETIVGPEVLAGSTRLKAGTAAKLALNMLSTATMARLGHVWTNLMVDMPATNAKLRARAEGMVARAADVPPARARRALAACGGSVRLAIAAAALGTNDAAKASAALAAAGGDLDAVLALRRRR